MTHGSIVSLTGGTGHVQPGDYGVVPIGSDARTRGGLCEQPFDWAKRLGVGPRRLLRKMTQKKVCLIGRFDLAVRLGSYGPSGASRFRFRASRSRARHKQRHRDLACCIALKKDWNRALRKLLAIFLILAASTQSGACCCAQPACDACACCPNGDAGLDPVSSPHGHSRQPLGCDCEGHECGASRVQFSVVRKTDASTGQSDVTPVVLPVGSLVSSTRTASLDTVVTPSDNYFKCRLHLLLAHLLV
jgi:hypothetical protein